MNPDFLAFEKFWPDFWHFRIFVKKLLEYRNGSQVIRALNLTYFFKFFDKRWESTKVWIFLRYFIKPWKALAQVDGTYDGDQDLKDLVKEKMEEINQLQISVDELRKTNEKTKRSLNRYRRKNKKTNLQKTTEEICAEAVEK